MCGTTKDTLTDGTVWRCQRHITEAKDNAALREELKRLTKERDSWMSSTVFRVGDKWVSGADLVAENERLREALVYIAGFVGLDPEHRVRQVARAALSEKGYEEDEMGG